MVRPGNENQALNFERKNISISPEQAEYIKKNHISLSRFVQSVLDERIRKESTERKESRRNVTTFFYLSFLGLATLLSGLLLPVFAGASTLPSVLVAVIGGAVLIFGLSEVRWWSRIGAGG